MKLIPVAILAAMLALGGSGEARAGGYVPVVGGSIYWADSNFVVGLNYGGVYAAPYYVAPYYAPPRYVYRPVVYARPYRDVYYGGKHKGYSRGYKHGYRQSDYDRRGRGHKGRGRGHHGDR